MRTFAKRQLFTSAAAGRWRGLVLALGAVASACTPVFNWRQVQADDGLQALFPCKPQAQLRRVALAGRSVEMRMLACPAGELTWALSTAETGDATAVEPALQALQAALGAHAAGTPQQRGPAVVPGATPRPSAAHIEIAGKRRDGQALEVEAWTFARGTRVYQASVIRPGPADARLREAQEQFFSSLSFNAAAGR